MLAYQPIRSLATINMAIYQGATAFKRISDIIDKEIEIKNDEDLPNLVIQKSNINFNNVSFKYQKTTGRAVKDLNISISGGSSAFVGHSGAIKSTIINLLQGFMIHRWTNTYR